jgi:hypothetical protein
VSFYTLFGGLGRLRGLGRLPRFTGVRGFWLLRSLRLFRMGLLRLLRFPGVWLGWLTGTRGWLCWLGRFGKGRSSRCCYEQSRCNKGSENMQHGNFGFRKEKRWLHTWNPSLKIVFRNDTIMHLLLLLLLSCFVNE